MMMKKIPLALLFVFVLIDSPGRNRDNIEAEVLEIGLSRAAELLMAPWPAHLDAVDDPGLAESLAREKSARLAAEKEVIALRKDIRAYQRTQNRIAAMLAGVFLALVFFVFRYYHQKRTVDRKLEKEIRERTMALRSMGTQAAGA